MADEVRLGARKSFTQRHWHFFFWAAPGQPSASLCFLGCNIFGTGGESPDCTVPVQC